MIASARKHAVKRERLAHPETLTRQCHQDGCKDNADCDLNSEGVLVSEHPTEHGQSIAFTRAGGANVLLAREPAA